MNNTALKRIIRKEHPTGKELGRIEVALSANQYGAYRDGTGKYEPLLSVEEEARYITLTDGLNRKERGGQLSEEDVEDWLQMQYYAALAKWLEMNTIYTQVNNEEYLRYYNGLSYELKLTVTTEELFQVTNKSLWTALLESTFTDNALEKFFPEATGEKEKQLQEHVLFLRKAVLAEYTLLSNFNYVLDRIATIHKTPEITVLKLNTDSIEHNIKVYNEAQTALNTFIDDSSKGTPELKKKKAQAIDKYFSPLRVEDSIIEPAEKFSRQINKLIKDFSPFIDRAADSELQRLIYTEKERG